MNSFEFEWDAGNIRHVMYDHPERGNTRAEIESIFNSPHFQSEFDREDPKTGELRYYTLGVGTEGVVKYVVFVIRNGKIRPITCFTADSEQRSKYYERVSSQATQSGRSGPEPGDSGDTQELVVPTGS